MDISQKLLGLLFALSAAAGSGLGALWSLLRLFRALCGVPDVDKNPDGQDTQACACSEGEDQCPQQSCRHILRSLRVGSLKAVLFLCDILFGLTCGCVLILLLYYTNDGQFRFLAVLGMGCGFFVWRHTLGRLADALTDVTVCGLHKLARLLVRLLRGSLRFLCRCFLWPLRMLYRLWMTVCGRRLAARRVRLARERARRATDAWFDTQIKQASCGFRTEDTPEGTPNDAPNSAAGRAESEMRARRQRRQER